MRAENKNPGVMRLLGAGNEDTGKLLGLDKEWAYRAIKAVGNYGEQFERHVGPKTSIGLPRGVNNLWSKGGVMYAPPFVNSKRHTTETGLLSGLGFFIHSPI